MIKDRQIAITNMTKKKQEQIQTYLFSKGYTWSFGPGGGQELWLLDKFGLHLHTDFGIISYCDADVRKYHSHSVEKFYTATNFIKHFVKTNSTNF